MQGATGIRPEAIESVMRVLRIPFGSRADVFTDVRIMAGAALAAMKG